MKKQIIKLSYEQEKRLSYDFLNMIGKVIFKNRAKHNISQKELAECLDVSESSISNYENGNQDMPVSRLPLISTYCDFDITEYFQPETVNYVKTFKSLIYIEKQKNMRRSAKSASQKDRRELVSRTYLENGKLVTREVEKKVVKVPFKDEVLSGHVETAVEPLSDNELQVYLESCNCVELLNSVSKILEYTESAKNTTALSNQMADFVLNEIFIENLKENDGMAKRIYAYYKKLLNEWQK
jgi:transcriptional regulator with XRE-family HTH domain